MSADAGELRAQAGRAREISRLAESAARSATPLAGYLPKITSAVERLISGSASGDDRAMLELLSDARRHQTVALAECQSAARAAADLAHRLEEEARAVEAREAAERAAAARRGRN